MKKGLSSVAAILILVSVVLVLTGVVISLYIFLGGSDHTSFYEEKIQSGSIVNPVLNLTDDEAASMFDKDFVYYLLVSIKAYNLRGSLFGSSPKIEVHVGELVYGAEISKGQIDVREGEISKEDIIVKTSVSEAVKMLRDENYIVESFNDGNSQIELVASKTTLAAKGYIGFYSELTGKTVE
jgi:hypothetical protein